MKKLILLLLLLPVVAMAQLNINQVNLKAKGQTYAFAGDTCAALFKNSTNALEDSTAIFYIHLGNWTGYGLGFPVMFCATRGGASCDSIKVEVAPRVRSTTMEADGKYLKTCWNDAVTLYTQAGVSCNLWAPVASRVYDLYHPTWWNGIAYSDLAMRMTNQSILADSAFVIKCLVHFQD
jgi:hypothetical protein